jgi:hypothetical protein
MPARLMAFCIKALACEAPVVLLDVTLSNTRLAGIDGGICLCLAPSSLPPTRRVLVVRPCYIAYRYGVCMAYIHQVQPCSLSPIITRPQLDREGARFAGGARKQKKRGVRSQPHSAHFVGHNAPDPRSIRRRESSTARLRGGQEAQTLGGLCLGAAFLALVHFGPFPVGGFQKPQGY